VGKWDSEKGKGMSDGGIKVVISGGDGQGKTAVRLLLQEALSAHGHKWTLHDYDEHPGEIPGEEARTREDLLLAGIGQHLPPELRGHKKIKAIVRIREKHDQYKEEA
jgi:Mrp family chromosome partitioning ATPase